MTNVVYGGSSITNAATTGYRTLSSNFLQWTYRDKTFTIYNASQSGRTSWNNLFRYAEYSAQTPDLVIFDNANDDVVGIGRRSVEALVRRLWTDFPLCKIVLVKVFNVTDRFDDSAISSCPNAGQQAEFAAVAAHYGIPIVPYWDAVQAYVTAGNPLFRFLIDTVHPSPCGHCLMSSLLEPYLTPTFLDTRQSPAVLPVQLYDNGDYENPSQTKNGTAYDSITGSWTPSGTTISSSSAGATVTYSGTFQSIGRPEEDGTVQVSVDGGAYAAITLGPNGATNAALNTRAAHTVTLKVMSGTVTISKFWAL